MHLGPYPLERLDREVGDADLSTVPAFTCPQDLMERANHIKSFGYFCDASMVGISRIPDTARLRKPYRNNDVDRLANDLKTRQTKTLASGIDMIMPEDR